MATGADAATSWQQNYTWCAPYSHPHPHHHHHHHHPHHPRQYQSNQYQQLPSNTSTINAATHYPSSQQHHLQLQNSTQPPPLDQQQHLHAVRGQETLRRAAPYDGPGIRLDRVCRARVKLYDHRPKYEIGVAAFLRSARHGRLISAIHKDEFPNKGTRLSGHSSPTGDSA